MAVIRDVMPAFQLYQPSSVADAQQLLETNGDDALVLAGGLDSMDWLKDRIKKPKVVVDLSGVDELKGIRETADGVEIGAMTTLTEVARNPVIRGKYGGESIGHGARPDCTGCQVCRDDSERPAGSPGRRLLRRA